jgi:thiol-disulfide isomerase/thioredoxin
MRLFALLTLFGVAQTGSAAPLFQAEGYRIEVQLNGFQETEAYLAYYFGDKQYIKDTASVGAEGTFVFQGDELLDGGVYLVVLPPDNQYFQILIDEEEQNFSLRADLNDLVNTMVFENAPDNTRFNEYLRYLSRKRPEATGLQTKMEEAGPDSEEYARLKEELDALNEDVLDYQQSFVSAAEGSLSSALVRANLPLDVPEMEGEDEEEIRRKKFLWTRSHFFDQVDLSDERLLRSPVLFEKVDMFVKKLRVQHPDSLAEAIDQVLARMDPEGENFRFFLIHYLNEAAKSKIVGMDALYVHLANQYYATGKADWTEPEQLEKIIDNAQSLEPLLIGKTAPDLELQTRDGKKVRLHELDSKYTILYIWRYDCGVCKKSTPDIKAFYEEFKDQGVEIYAVCFKFGDEVSGCWDYIEEKGIGDWIHVVDPYNQSRFSQTYYIKSTPQLYILDKDKKILSKRIGADQLKEVMGTIIQADAEEEGSAEKGK